METDLNLLFGVLAVQADLIDANQLAEACGAWAIRKSVPLADIMQERGWITAEDRNDIQKLLQRKLEKNRGDVKQSLAQAADITARDAIREIEDSDIRQSLNGLPPVQRLPPIASPSIAAAEHSPDETVLRESFQRSRYSYTRQHGKGGLGIVWLVRDSQLNRDIALKEIRPEHAGKLDVSQRFVCEAQVTGQLEHPNIVSVYELGRRPEDGKPFYTMRFVRGQTLRDAISEYHRRRIAGQAHPLELRRLLGCLVSICNALEYAHSRGVIHRDLKPENVILGGFGEVIVLDWGLAKILDQQENSEIEHVALSDGVEMHETQGRGIIGTAPYMSPEQAEGRIDLLDKRTDIYGLGAILFELLTGGAPHRGGTLSEVLARITNGPTPLAKDVLPGVPAGLNAICAKAMSKSRASRYAHAADLADDLQRWLADEPVSAYPEPLRVRVARWTRRHRAWTQAAAVTLFLVTMVSSISAVMIDQARFQTERRRQQAVKAVDAWGTGFNDFIRFNPGVQAVRLELLKNTVEVYEDLSRGTSGNSQDKLEYGRNVIRLGECQGYLRQWEPASKSFETAVERFEELLRIPGVADEAALELADALGRLAMAQAILGKAPISEETFRKSIAVLERTPAEPFHTRFRDASLELQIKFGLNLAENRKETESEKLLRELPEKFRLLTSQADDPKVQATYRRANADACFAWSQALYKLNRYPEAVNALRKAVEIYTALFTEYPHNFDYLDGRAACHVALSNAMRPLGKDLLEVEEYQRAMEDYTALCTHLHDIPHYREHLALTKVDLAQKLHELGMNQTAKSQAIEALTILLDLEKDYRNLPISELQIGTCESILGRVLRDLKEVVEAEVAFKNVLTTCEGVLKQLPDSPDALRLLATSRSHYARLLHQLKRDGESETAFQQSIEDYTRLQKKNPDDMHLRDSLASTQAHYGDLLLTLRQPAKAGAAYAAARALRAGLNQFPAHVYKFASLLLNCQDPGIRSVPLALETARRAAELVPENGRYQTLLGAALYRNHNYDKCLECLKKALPLNSEQDALNWYYLGFAQHASGDSQVAKTSIENAVRIQAEQAPADTELQRLQIEAAKLLPEMKSLD